MWVQGKWLHLVFNLKLGIKDQFQAQFNLNVHLTLCSAQSIPDPFMKMKFSALLLQDNSGSLLQLQRC